MKLNHIALSIQDKEDLIDFYQNILGFSLEYQYEINATLSSTIFDIEKPTEVHRYSKDNLHFEFFITTEKITPVFAHIGIDVVDRETIADKCNRAGYQVIRVERKEKYDLLFVSDKAGNKLELKDL